MHVFGNSVTSVTNLNLERSPVKMGGRVLLQPPLTAVSLSQRGGKFTLENHSPSHLRSDVLIFRREINTLAAPSHSHTAKLAVSKDIRLSSSEVSSQTCFQHIGAQ